MLRRAIALAAITALITVLTGCGSDLTSADRSPVAAAGSPRATPANPASTPASATASVGALAAAPDGVFLPDSARTPGATNRAVTQANIGQTICLPGYTSTIRPTSSVTTGLKKQQLSSGYAYHGDMSTRDYEEDHLISLEVGGSPDSPLNLWPEPYAGHGGARTKDKIENRLHALVCSGQLPLATAQHAIATDWWAAYQTYGG